MKILSVILEEFSSFIVVLFSLHTMLDTKVHKPRAMYIFKDFSSLAFVFPVVPYVFLERHIHI